MKSIKIDLYALSECEWLKPVICTHPCILKQIPWRSKVKAGGKVSISTPATMAS